MLNNSFVEWWKKYLIELGYREIREAQYNREISEITYRYNDYIFCVYMIHDEKDGQLIFDILKKKDKSVFYHDSWDPKPTKEYARELLDMMDIAEAIVDPSKIPLLVHNPATRVVEDLMRGL